MVMMSNLDTQRRLDSGVGVGAERVHSFTAALCISVKKEAFISWSRCTKCLFELRVSATNSNK